MIQRAFFLTMILLSLAVSAFAQDPLEVAPQAYKLQFENEWVKVTRVHYAPHEKLATHDHTEAGAAYVYLNDGGPVTFKHIGLSYGAVTRPETKAGSFRIYKGIKETHEVENLNDVPSDFMRVEFKTVQDTTKPLRGKFLRETYPTGENFQKVHFENEQIKATRLVCISGKACDMPVSATTPALIVALTPGKFAPAGGKSFDLEPGKTKWIEAGKKKVLKNTGKEPIELLLFELKAKPTGKMAADGHAHN